jgi:hypothetical protein
MGKVISPYCALEYVDHETRYMGDPSGYACIVRSQKLLRILDAIGIKVPDTKVAEISDLLEAAPSIFLYIVIIV